MESTSLHCVEDTLQLSMLTLYGSIFLEYGIAPRYIVQGEDVTNLEKVNDSVVICMHVLQKNLPLSLLSRAGHWQNICNPGIETPNRSPAGLSPRTARVQLTQLARKPRSLCPPSLSHDTSVGEWACALVYICHCIIFMEIARLARAIVPRRRGGGVLTQSMIPRRILCPRDH